MKTAETVDAIVRSTVEGLGFELCDVEFAKEAGNWVLTLYIDREGGVTIDDCEAVSHAVDPVLDAADPIPQSYYLSVSSLGLDRPLKKDRDFQRSLGQKIDVRLYAPLNGQKQFLGVLTSFDAASVTIDSNGETRTFDMKSVALIRLYPDIDGELSENT